MRIRIKFRRPPVPSVEPALFGDVFVPRQPRWRFLLASAAIHWLVLAIVPTLLQAWTNNAHDEPDWRAYNAGPLIIQVPEPLHWPARPHPQPSPQAEKQAGGRPAANQALRAQARASRGLELPVTQHISDQAPVILQPDPVKLPSPSVPALPSMAFWTNTAPAPPRRRAVIPGSLQHSQATPNLDAPPALSPSRPRLTASDVPLNQHDAQAPPKLPHPNGSTNPVRLRGQAATELASFDVPLSDPVNLIYLMAHHPPAQQAEIPHGLQNTPRETGAAASLEPGRPASAPDQAGAGLAVDRVQSTHDARDRAVSPESAGGAVGAAGSQISTATGHQPASPVTRASGPAQESVIRVNHPSSGNFDVVILQSVARDDLPEVGASLSGNPVYTVYLSVGDAREWLLEYCIPANGGSQTSSFQVNIDDQGSVAAPYPLSTVIPRNVFELPHPNHLVLHGLLSTAGTLRAVETPNPDSGLLREVLPLLSQWRFRPALRDRAPVEVEVLLIIPPRT